MIAFGGAAPLHAGRLCEKLGVERLLVPPGAGVGSAIGFLRAPFSFEANRSVYMKLSDFDAADQGTLLAELQQEATGFVRNCDASADLVGIQSLHALYRTGLGNPIMLTKRRQRPRCGTFLRPVRSRLHQAVWPHRGRAGHGNHRLVRQRHNPAGTCCPDQRCGGHGTRAGCRQTPHV